METEELEERSPKRLKFSQNGDAIETHETRLSNSSDQSQRLDTNAEIEKEKQVGITAFINNSTQFFHAVLKTRYTDFLVNEISMSGDVLHLQSTRPERGSLHERRSPQNTGASSKQAAVATEGGTNAVTESAKTGSVANSTVTAASQNTPPNPRLQDDFQISTENKGKLTEYLNELAVTELCELNDSIRRHPNRRPRDHPTVRTEFTTDRYLRSEIHQFIREIFQSRIESSTDHEGFLVLKAASADSRKHSQQDESQRGPKEKHPWRPGKLGWEERGGEYLYFTLYKENKDTMEVISWLNRQLKCSARTFQFAGTKDRRAVTVQRCSAYRMDADRIASQNRGLKQASIGDFEYKRQGLELGELEGNEFVITLRDCKFPDMAKMATGESIESIRDALLPAMRDLHERGFLNYYGLQRFGTFSLRTDMIGLNILKEDFKAAVDAILHFQPEALAAAEAEGDGNSPQGTTIGQDDRSRALAIHKWRLNRKLNQALDALPRKFSAETQLIRHLSRNPSDYLGALMQIQRNMRLMYVHAYQSYVWNLAVSERWRLFGDKVTQGDLVLVDEHKNKTENSQEANKDGQTDNSSANVDADGEIIIRPEGDDRAGTADDIFERARALTQQEAQSGHYSIFDIVLPLPGYDVEYPANESGAFYKTFMASAAGGNLNPYSMRRKQRDFSLSGSYRKMFARIGAAYDVVGVHRYTRDDEQFVTTDLERIRQKEREDCGQDDAAAGSDAQQATDSMSAQDKIAVVLKFQLGSSQYATMALRELSRGGITAHKPEYSGGR